MPKWLTKEYGPFTGTVWVVIIVGGVGLGLVMRRFMPRGDGTGDTAATSPAAVTGSPNDLSPAFAGTGTLYNQGEIVSDVLEALKDQLPPLPTTDPEVKPTPTPPNIIINIPKPVTPSTPKPVAPKPPVSAPKPPATGSPRTDSGGPPYYEHLRAAVQATGHNPGSHVDPSDVAFALRKAGFNPGTHLDPGDIAALQNWYKARK